MDLNQKRARVAGLLYLIVAITGGFAHFSIRESLIVPGNGLQTANNIMASQTLFRIGIVSDLVCQTVFIFVPLVLYKLFKPINKKHALNMVILVLVGVPIAFINTINQLGALQLLVKDNYLAMLGKETIHALVLLLLELNSIGILIAQIFWGLWLFPLGLLIYKSGFLPRIIAIMLMIAACIYTIGSVASFLLPQYIQLMEFLYWEPAIAEIVFCLWILIIGIRPKHAIIPQSI